MQKPEGTPKPEDVLFQSLGQAVPELEVELSEEEKVAPHGTLAERTRESPNLSDMQSVVLALKPELPDYLNELQVARIYPEEFDYFRSIIVKDLLKNHADWSLTKAIVIATTALSIAIDGEGRIDILRLAGAIKDAEEAEAISTGAKI